MDGAGPSSTTAACDAAGLTSRTEWSWRTRLAQTRMSAPLMAEVARRVGGFADCLSAASLDVAAVQWAGDALDYVCAAQTLLRSLVGRAMDHFQNVGPVQAFVDQRK